MIPCTNIQVPNAVLGKPSIRVFGTKCGLEWEQEGPDKLWFSPLGQCKQLITRNGPGVGEVATRVSRISPGYPEGYLERFANIYSEAVLAIRARQTGQAADEVVFQTVQDGLEGVAFVDARVRSSSRDSAWVKLAI